MKLIKSMFFRTKKVTTVFCGKTNIEDRVTLCGYFNTWAQLKGDIQITGALGFKNESRLRGNITF